MTVFSARRRANRSRNRMGDSTDFAITVEDVMADLMWPNPIDVESRHYSIN